MEAVLPATERYGVTDARAFLLERLGDVAAALQIHVDAASAANEALVEVRRIACHMKLYPDSCLLWCCGSMGTRLRPPMGPWSTLGAALPKELIQSRVLCVTQLCSSAGGCSLCSPCPCYLATLL